MSDTTGFDQRYESENFIFKIERPHFGDKDTDVRAKIYGSFKGNDLSAFYSEKKFTSRSLSGFAKDVCRTQDVDEDEYKEEIVSTLLKKKSELADIAEKRRDYLKENFQDNEEGDETDTLLNDVVERIYEHDNPKIEDFADITKFNSLIEANNDLILRQADKLLLTNKGKSKAEKLLGIKKIDDVNAEAEKVLEEGFIKYFLEAIDEVHKGDHELKVWELVSALSAKCSQRQINSWAVGPSGKGKSHIKRAIVKFLPDEAYEAPNSMSPKAMLYKTQTEGFDVFKGKLLFLDEAEGYDDQAALVLLRGLTDPDEDKFVHEMVKDQNHEELIIEKPVTVWFTSVESIADEQLKNRFILTNPDGSEELDDKVFNHQMVNLHTGQTLGEPPAEVEVVKEAIRIIRQDTAGLTPIVPFEVDWKQKFNRRLYPYFVTLMEIIAKMNYKNRVIKDNYIYVTRADFRLASTIWSALIDTTIAQTDTEALKLIMELPDRKGEAARSSELARNLDGFNTEKVRRKADNLRDTEELQLINVQKEGGKNEYWAGSDRELLLNPEPEIQIDPDTIKDILSKTEKGVDPMIIDSVNKAEIPVYDELKERQDEIKEQKLGEVNDWTVELEREEKKLLRLLEDTNFSSDLNFIVASFNKDKDETWSMLEELEEKGLIKIYDEDNKQQAKRTRTYKQQRSEGKISL